MILAVVGSSPIIYPHLNSLLITLSNLKKLSLKKINNQNKSPIIDSTSLKISIITKIYYNLNSLSNKSLFYTSLKFNLKIIKLLFFGLNLQNLNFKYFSFTQNKNNFGFSNKQAIKILMPDNNFKKTHKNLKSIKMTFLYFLKYCKNYFKNSDNNLNFFYFKNLNFFFFFNLYFFFKTLLNDLFLNFLFFQPIFSNNLNYKKKKSIKKRLNKKNLSNIKVF